MPPGGGKTRIAKHILAAFGNKEARDGSSGRALFSVQQRSLVDNAIIRFVEDPPLNHGVIMSGRESHGERDIQVGSIDTLLSWYCENGEYASTLTFDLIIYDEVHSNFSKLKTYLKAHQKKRDELGLSSPYVIGLSATPQADGLSGVFKQIVLGPDTRWLIEQGFLSPFRYFQGKKGDLSKLVKRGEEYLGDSIVAAMDGLAGDLVKDWIKHANGRATIGFFPRLQHARDAVTVFREHGVSAEYVDGKTPDEDRQKLFRDLNAGKIDYIANVGVIERGTDIPRIGCIQLCTAVGSVVRWRQMIGRGSRVHPDVHDCLVLDHADNVRRLGFFDDPIDWSLDWSKRASKMFKGRELIECPSCKELYRGGTCSKCGYEPTVSERKIQGLVFEGDQLKEVVKRKERKPKSNETLMTDALYAASRRGGTFRTALAMAYNMANGFGGTFRVPANFVVAKRTFRPIPRGHVDASRRVVDTYGFLRGDYTPSSNPYMVSK